MKRIALFIIVLLGLAFIGCGGGGGSATTTSSGTTITVVDGYIKDGNLTDSTGTQATYTSNGKYTFSGSPQYPLSFTGGSLKDTNASFDINMTAQEGSLVVSPITTFLENNATLLGKLANLGFGVSTLSEFQTNYVDTNNSNLAKLSQMLYVAEKDTTLLNAFKARLASNNPTNLSEIVTLLETDVNATIAVGYVQSYRAFLSKVKSLAITPSTYETALQQYKLNMNLWIAPLKKTGQTTSYTGYDDGNYTKGVASSYTRDNTNKIVTDNITKLQWQDDTTPSTMTWDNAGTYCTNLSLGTYTDWRLPTRKELVSLSDYGRTNPAIDPTFLNTISDDYWSSTTVASISNGAWLVSFSKGSQNYNTKTTNVYVRCVRAGQ